MKKGFLSWGVMSLFLTACSFPDQDQGGGPPQEFVVVNAIPQALVPLVVPSYDGSLSPRPPALATPVATGLLAYVQAHLLCHLKEAVVSTVLFLQRIETEKLQPSSQVVAAADTTVTPALVAEIRRAATPTFEHLVATLPATVSLPAFTFQPSGNPNFDYRLEMWDAGTLTGTRLWTKDHSRFAMSQVLGNGDEFQMSYDGASNSSWFRLISGGATLEVYSRTAMASSGGVACWFKTVLNDRPDQTTVFWADDGGGVAHAVEAANSLVKMDSTEGFAPGGQVTYQNYQVSLDLSSVPSGSSRAEILATLGLADTFVWGTPPSSDLLARLQTTDFGAAKPAFLHP